MEVKFIKYSSREAKVTVPIHAIRLEENYSGEYVVRNVYTGATNIVSKEDFKKIEAVLAGRLA